MVTEVMAVTVVAVAAGVIEPEELDVVVDGAEVVDERGEAEVPLCGVLC